MVGKGGRGCSLITTRCGWKSGSSSLLPCRKGHFVTVESGWEFWLPPRPLPALGRGALLPPRSGGREVSLSTRLTLTSLGKEEDGVPWVSMNVRVSHMVSVDTWSWRVQGSSPLSRDESHGSPFVFLCYYPDKDFGMTHHSMERVEVLAPHQAFVGDCVGGATVFFCDICLK